MGARESEPPRIRVAALTTLDEKVVLVRHLKAGKSYFLLPGGGVDRGETLIDALRREMIEETGLDISNERLLFVSDTIAPDSSRHVLNITFHADIVGGQVTEAPTDERVESVELIDPCELSDIDLRPPITNEVIQVLQREDLPIPVYLGSRFAPE